MGVIIPNKVARFLWPTGQGVYQNSSTAATVIWWISNIFTWPINQTSGSTGVIQSYKQSN